MVNFMLCVFYNKKKTEKKGTGTGTQDSGERHTISQPAEGSDPDVILPNFLF